MTTVNAFDVLGVEVNADREQIKRAYHRQAKESHPDLFSDPAQQEVAQKRMVELNLAYEQALKMAKAPVFRFHELPLEQIKPMVRRLIDQKQLEGAMLQLSRADHKDADWYALQGEILMAFKEFDTAHQSFREAVRLSPDNLSYRQMALDAALELKRRRLFPVRLKDSIEALFQRGRRR